VRQVVLVIVLIAAAFLGGAFVNGPGLRWAQTQLLGSLGLNEEGEIASVDLKGAVNPGAAGEASRASKAGATSEAVASPFAPVPSFVTETESSKKDESDGPSNRPGADPRPSASPRSSSPTAPPPLTAPLTTSQSAPGRPKTTAPMETIPVSPSPEMEPPALLDPSVNSALTSPPGSQPPRDRDIAPVLLDSLASLMPANPPSPPGPSPVATGPSARIPPPRSFAGPAVSAGEDWAALSRKMQALGVSRFTIEGQPGGPVVFSCLIPLVAGRQAVAQRFEAEGPDAFHAAQAALRRIALWRATQNPSSP